MSVVAPEALLGRHEARCSFCGETEPLPADLDERVRGLRIRLAEIRFAEQIEEAPALGVARSVETWRAMTAPGLVAISLLLVLGGVVSVASLVGRPVSLGVIVQTALYPVSGLVLILGIALGSFLSLRAYARDLRPRLEAQPPLSDGSALRCRACGADLPRGGNEGIVACAYCGAENVVRPEIARERIERLEQEKAARAARLAGHRVRFDDATRTYLTKVYATMALSIGASLLTMLVAALLGALLSAIS